MLVHPQPNPIAFSIGPVDVHWYGIMYVIAFALFIILGRVRIRTQPHVQAQGWTDTDPDDMLLSGMLVFVIMWLFARKPRPRLAVGALYTTLYGCARFFTEWFRVPDWETHVFGMPITSGQVLSLPMIVAGLIMLGWAYSNGRRQPAH